MYTHCTLNVKTDGDSWLSAGVCVCVCVCASVRVRVRVRVCVMQHDAVSNLRKAKSLYISRQQELDKLKEQAAKAETDGLSLAVIKAEAKTEKKKKQEDDALQKVACQGCCIAFSLCLTSEVSLNYSCLSMEQCVTGSGETKTVRVRPIQQPSVDCSQL